MTYLERAIQDGHAVFIGDGKQRKIKYIAMNHTEKYSDPEEQVRAEFWAELIYRYGYEPHRIGIEIRIPDRVPTDIADLVIFRDDERKKPYAVIECKKDGITDNEFYQAIEQGFGNKMDAEYVMVVAGTTRRAFYLSKEMGVLERNRNIIADIPEQYGKVPEFKYHKEGTLDIVPVSQDILSSTIRKSHQSLWGAGKFSPPQAFSELCKIIFIKISDEKAKRKSGEPYQFQIKTHETNQQLASRIHQLYEEQRQRDPNVFTEGIRADDDALAQVVAHLEGLNLNKTDLDTKGVAFEQFMDGFFKGSFGQYFTPREIIQFIMEIMQPTNEHKIIDPACGSGGFLLHALDAVRREADEYFSNHNSRDHFEHWHTFALNKLYGIEINDDIARVAKMNMIIHDDGHTNVIRADALEHQDTIIRESQNHNFANYTFDMVLTNPPFGGEPVNLVSRKHLVDDYDMAEQEDKQGKKKPRKSQKPEILFIERVWHFLKSGTGEAAIILPDGILSNASNQYVRDWIIGHFQIKAVVSLPQYAFAYFGAGVKASILFLRKRAEKEQPNPDEPIFMASPQHIGYDATGRKTKQNDFHQIAELYRQFQKDHQPFFQVALSRE